MHRSPKNLVGVHKRAHQAGAHLYDTPLPETAFAIEAKEISFSYDKTPFIEGLNVEIPRACVTSIVGPNGCGKSTLLKIVDGILAPQSGEAFIGGIPTTEMGGKERARHLALLIQGARPPAMTVEALVSCGRYPYQGHLHQLTAEDKRCVEEAMALTDVERFRGHDVRYLSGGERQRAFIAMTLAQDTDIIALDEPTTYLDVHACHDIMKLVCDLNRTANKTIVMVIHDLDLALRYSDHLVVMERGKCLYSGTVDEVLESKAIDQAFHVEVKKIDVDGREAYSLFPR